MGKSQKSNIYIIFEETNDFQMTFINNYLFIYILRTYMLRNPNKFLALSGVGL